jgi:hypothetical protein
VRVLIATNEEHGGFPHDHIEMTWQALQNLAKQPWAEDDWEKVVTEAFTDIIRRQNLTGYVSQPLYLIVTY